MKIITRRINHNLPLFQSKRIDIIVQRFLIITNRINIDYYLFKIKASRGIETLKENYEKDIRNLFKIS